MKKNRGVGTNKINTKNTKGINIFCYKILGVLFVLFLALIPLFLKLQYGIFTKISDNDIKFPLTADSLITGATITLIVFTNFAPSGSSGSSSIIRRVYWRSTKVSNSMDFWHKILWNVTLSWLKPSYIISLTLLTTLTEVFVLYFQAADWLPYGLIIITSVLLLTALVRFVLFHLYANKNVAVYLHSEYLKIIKTGKSKPSIWYDFLSFFRMTSNFELLYVILRKFHSSKKLDTSIQKIMKNKNYKEVDAESIIHHNKEEYEKKLTDKIKNLKSDKPKQNKVLKKQYKKLFNISVASDFVILLSYNIYSNDNFSKGSGKDKIITEYMVSVIGDEKTVKIIKNAAFAFNNKMKIKKTIEVDDGNNKKMIKNMKELSNQVDMSTIE